MTGVGNYTSLYLDCIFVCDEDLYRCHEEKEAGVRGLLFYSFVSLARQ